ncbi:MAG: DEAD/DEAH box helicase, partial [Acidobacteria bacterium]|nr:DEAD/DEAH box helicase [Acidobacteriota bacterium]
PPAWTMLVLPEDPDGRPVRSCSCGASRKATCEHVKALSEGFRTHLKAEKGRSLTQRFAASRWYRLARLLFEGEPYPAAEVELSTVQIKESPGKAGSRGGKRGHSRGTSLTAMRVAKTNGQVLAECLEVSDSGIRFAERFQQASDGARVPRGQLLDRLAMVQWTKEERRFAQAGMKLGRQVWEESFWHRLAYHGFRETDGSNLAVEPVIDRHSGEFKLTLGTLAEKGQRTPRFRVTVPRDRVRAVLQFLAAEFPGEPALQVHPVPLKSIFRITAGTELDLSVKPVIQLLQASGEERFFAREDLERFTYGRLVYLPELEILAELETPGKERNFKAPQRMRLARSQVPSYLSEHLDAVEAGALVVDPSLGEVEVFRSFEGIEISAADLEEGGYELTGSYLVGSHPVSFSDILEARAQGRPFLEVGDGWLDLNTPSLELLEELAKRSRRKASGPEPGPDASTVRLVPSALLRLQADADRPLQVSRRAAGRAALERLLELRPSCPYQPAEGFRSQLRPYQVLGAEWLTWVWENRLGALLADDMGLGKTHQTLALMTRLRELDPGCAPLLVVCPTSVLSHWEAQAERFAPGLPLTLHHGPQRRWPSARRRKGRVLLTSYGVLRRDAEVLAKVPFSLIVFDEIQNLKNRDTQAFQAAARLQGGAVIGLTGTPVENSLGDLKALFDLVLPGYLGSDSAFVQRFGGPQGSTALQVEELRRVLGPFILRRTKQAVLDELPPKFEEERLCRLSQDQAELYRTAVRSRGKALAEKLRQTDHPIPYIHVFALLNLLKQICDHPALALSKLDEAERYRCGKWELFCELLDEALASGLKVVVFSQYLGMITLMSRHLSTLGVGFEVLTGATQDRGPRIRRFNEDPECRVFVGSLKAGGTGIDLIGGSVVIHYDRWWNAAREDQATDRVYRMGQRRAVHVLKLVTEGTLEEKISLIIAAKRELMDQVVQEDDPKLAKIFSREELLDLLSTV